VDSAGAPPHRQPAKDEYHSGAGNEQVSPFAASQHQQATNDHCHAAASIEQPIPSTHGSTLSFVTILVVLWIPRKVDSKRVILQPQRKLSALQ
jgi:hypothetical protein